MEKLKRVGIIGGMGSLATADLFFKIISLTNAKCDSEHIPLLIDNYAQIPDRTKFILGNGENPLPYLVESANRLKNGDCQAIAIACNTAHYFVDDLKKSVDIEILHIADIAVKAIKNQFPDAKKIAPIATTATKQAKIYDKILQEYGYDIVEISKDKQEGIMSCIYDGVKANKIDEYAPKFIEILQTIDADVYIAGCTEVPIFLPYVGSNYKFIDSSLELAKEIIRFSKSK